jgi:predicted AAA+ superfamily ATPase
VAGRADYRARIVDDELASGLRVAGAVLVEGARGCGKTRTARQLSASEVLLDVDDRAREAGLLDASLLLDGDSPRLVDEWQLVPDVWGKVRRAVDDDKSRRFILTGSAEAPEDPARHSGAMRILRLLMRPMSLFELGDSTGQVPLASLLAGATVRAADSGLDIRALTDIITRGGWPALLGASANDALRVLDGYLQATAEVDLRRLDGPRFDAERVLRTLRSLARNTTTSIRAQGIARDVEMDGGQLDRETVAAYLAALRRIYVLDDLPPWAPSLRATARARTSPKHHLVDPSLAVAAMGADPDRLRLEPDTLGVLFESLVVRDLRVYAQANNGAKVYHYTEQRIEADAIVEARDGTYAAFEVKLGPSQVDSGAASLRAFAARMKDSRQGPPASLNVITGWGYGFTRPDGVNVIPIGALAP